jgi:hypothetical protein
VGDLLYADTTTTLAKLPDVATGNALISGGVGVAPSWGKIGLTTHVSGTLPTANGGTNLTSFTSGGVVYASSTSALATGAGLKYDGNFSIGTTTPYSNAAFTTLNVGGSQAGKVGFIGLFNASDTMQATIDNFSNQFRIGTNGTSNPIVFYTGGGVTEALRIDSSQNTTFSTGNIVQGTAAKGINFTANTPAAGMTTQLLGWYEEGDWTPSDDSGASLTITVTSAKYVRLGRTVFVQAYIAYPVTASVANAKLKGLPFTVATNIYAPFTSTSGCGTVISVQANSATTTMTIVTAANFNTAVQNVTLSGGGILFSGHYTI